MTQANCKFSLHMTRNWFLFITFLLLSISCTTHVSAQHDHGDDSGTTTTDGTTTPTTTTSHGSHSQYFHNNWQDVYLIFEDWQLNNKQVYIFSLIGIFALACVYEILHVIQKQVDEKLENQLLESPFVTSNSIEDPKPSSSSSSHTIEYFKWSHQAIRSTLHLVKVFLGYFLMLVFMTMEVGLCLSVLAGLGSGFFLFARKTNLKSQACC